MNKKKVFFVGIGGIGVSSLAKYFYKNNYEIFGSDFLRNENIVELEKKYNLVFFHKHSEKNIFEGLDLLIYSPAVSENNKERIKAQSLRIPEFSYPKYLGKISENKKTFAITGTNGKTTTTTMVAELLDNFQEEATVVMGGISKKFNSNFLFSQSENFVVEACEFKASFLNIFPDVIAITNITPDHLDYFNTFENYKRVFLDFLDNYKDNLEKKILICDETHKNLKEIIEKAREKKIKIIDYKKYQIEKITIPGEYNRKNAQIALAVCDLFGINLDEARAYLENNYIGTERRFDFVGESKSGVKIYDDYAHNPEGLAFLKSGLDEKFPNKKKVIIFQPHLFSRTEDFFEEFVKSLSLYEEVFLLPIYKSREKEENFKVDSKMLFEKIKETNAEKINNNDKIFPAKKISLCEDFEDCIKKIKERGFGKNEILITVGAGDVFKIGKKII